MNEDILRKAADELAAVREQNLREQQRRFKECCRLNSRIFDISSENSELVAAIIRITLSGNTDNLSRLKDRSLALRTEQEQILNSLGKPENWLDPIYSCPVCKDTGITDDRRCDCVRKLIAEINTRTLNARSPMKLHTFEEFDLSFYDDKNDPKFGESPRSRMTQIYNKLRGYAANFSPASKSLLLWGQPGLGKTHLALSVASVVLSRGFSVAYIPANDLFAQLDRERFSNDEDNDTLKTVLNCDLFILDDLGTEYLNAFIQSQLYTIINDRLLARKPTIISTNLEPGELDERYPRRLVSRIMGEYADFLLTGKDVRIIKKYK